jgi:hypothetical protein
LWGRDRLRLYVIASAVVGGASLSGAGHAVSATLGAVLIVLIRQSILTPFRSKPEWIIIGAPVLRRADQASARRTETLAAMRQWAMGQRPRVARNSSRRAPERRERGWCPASTD